MAEAEAFVIPIEADGSQADSAADSVDSLAASLDTVEASSGSMSDAFTSSGDAATDAASNIDTLADSLDDLESSADSAGDSMEDAGDSFSLADVDARNLGSGFTALGGPMGKIGGKAAKVVDGFKKMAVALGPVGAAIAATTVALVALGAATIFVIAKMAKFAITSNKVAMDRLTKATDKAKKSLTALFADVDVMPFVEAFEDVLSLFDEGTEESKALKTIVEGILDPLFEAAAVVGPFVKEMFRGMIFAALQAAIVVAKLRVEILKAIPPETRAMLAEIAAQVDWMAVAFYGGAVAITVITVALVVLTAIVAAAALVLGAVLLTAVLVVAFPFILLAAAVAAVIAILYVLYSAVTAGVEFLGELAAAGYEAAEAMVDGLVQGIKSGASEFVDAVTAQERAGHLESFEGVRIDRHECR
jgi:hypothetical protein